MRPNNRNQRKFIRRVANVIKKAKGNLDASKEYQKVYPLASKASATVQASVILNSEHGKKTLAEYLNESFPKEKRAARLEELAYAEKDHVLQDGTIIPIRDNQASLRSLELIMKASGDLRQDGESVDARSIHYHIGADEAKRLAAIADKLEALENDTPITPSVEPDASSNTPTSTQ
jgi:hypothetical protein